MDNIFIERLWGSLKCEAVNLQELSDGSQAHRVVARWMAFYNARRPHTGLEGLTPLEFAARSQEDRNPKPLTYG